MIAEPFPLGPMEPQIHQIPPPELVDQWYREADDQLASYYVYIAAELEGIN